MSEELIPPFTGPISKETAQFRAKQAVEYYHKQLKLQPSQGGAVQKWEAYEGSVNGHGGGRDTNHNNDGRHSVQSQYSEPPERFVRGGHRATVHGTNTSVRVWHKNNHTNNTNNQRTQNYNNNVDTRRHHMAAPQEHRTGSKKRYSRGLHRSNSNLEESLECINVEDLDISMSSKREYGSTSSLDMMNASTSSDSFFQMLEILRPETTDQRSPAPSKLHEVLRGSRNEAAIKNKNLLRDLEHIANGSMLNNRPVSDEVDDGTQSPRTKAKFKQKERKLRSKSITPETVPGVWKRIRGKNEMEGNTKTQDSVLDAETRGDDRFRRKAFVHYDSQSIGFNINAVLKRKTSVNVFSNITTGASAASGTRESYAGESDDPGIAASTDDGDGRSNDLVHSCSFFRNEIGGEEERNISLSHRTAHLKQSSNNTHTRSAIVFTRSPQCCGVTILDCSPTLVGHILPPHTTHKGHVIEYMDTGANYYRHFFNSSDHQNYFGVDENLGPVAVSIKREKLDERENNLGKSESGLYQYRVILRTSELTALRGSVLEDAIQTTGRLSSSKGIPIKDLLEFLVPEVQSSCLRQATVGQKTCDQLIKIDEQRVFSTYKIGILYCKAGQSAEEDMYNNEHGSPAFDEFLNMMGDKVRLKGFEKYRAQLDNKTDSTGTHSVYTTFNNAEIMFHVSTLLPFTPKNQQQLLRKRHIGNDIVTVIFQEPGSAPFTARSVRSQFQHVFIIVRVHNPCSDKTSYSIAISRSKDVPPFGPLIPEHAKFPRSKEFAEFLLAKIINAENAAHHSEKFSAMASRTRHEYLKDLAANHVTSNSLESASKLSKFALSGKKKEKNRGKVVPDNFALGAVVWHVQVEDVGRASTVNCYLGIAAETLVIVEEATKHVIFTTHCGSIIGWTSQALSMKLYYNQGECVMFQPSSGDMEELQEIVLRLSAVTPGCETAEFTLKRNGLGQLGFHIQAEGIVTDVENLGFASEAGLRKGSRLVEICKVSTVTLSHDQMVDLLRTSATVKVVVIPPLKDGGPRYIHRGVVNLHANHHYSSFPALNAVFQAEYSIHQRQARSSSSSSENLLSPISPREPSPREPVFLKMAPKRNRNIDEDKDVSYKEVRESWELREIRRQGSKDSYHQREASDYEVIHERGSSISSCQSQGSQRSNSTLPLQKKLSSSSSSTSSSDHRGEFKSPSITRTIHITDASWQSSSLPHGNKTTASAAGHHAYQDSIVSSGHGSLYEGRDTAGDQYSNGSRGLDDSSYGTLEERHTRTGSKDSGDHHLYGGGSRDWSTRPQRPPPPTQSSQWSESRSTSSHSTYLTSSTENIYSSSSQSARKQPSNSEYAAPSVQHGNYAHELLKQSQNTKYLLSQGSESSRKEGGNSAHSSSINLSDTSFSSGGSATTANMPHPAEKDDVHHRRRANTTSVPHPNKSRNPAVGRNPAVNMSPASSAQSSPRSSQKNLSGMSSEESLSTRLRPGVTTRLTKSKGVTNLQDDLMRLIDPDLDENDLHGILVRSSNRHLSGRLVRTMSDESLHSGKTGRAGEIDPDLREALFAAKHQETHSSREQLDPPNRLSPRAVTEGKVKVPMPDSMANLDWSSLVNVATKAIETSPESLDRISSPDTSTASSNTSNLSLANKSTDSKTDSLYKQKPHDRPLGPPTGNNPPVWRSVVANPHARIQELEAKVEQLEDELAQERQESAALDLEVQRLRNENARLQEESQTAAAQLRRFTEWFFTTIDRQ